MSDNRRDDEQVVMDRHTAESAGGQKLTEEEANRLVEAARQARLLAYAPYSNFAVGAAVLGHDGQIYTGCNVENVSYGLTNCAERTAIFKAVSEGDRKIRAIAIFADTEQFCSPCGPCRQVMAEFGKEILVVQADKGGRYVINTVEQLLPWGFYPGMMGKDVVE